jgi:septal ring factor EnvC (AmiA/AmiB activator)
VISIWVEEQKLSQAKSRISELERQLNDTNAKISQLEKQLSEAKETISQIKERIEWKQVLEKPKGLTKNEAERLEAYSITYKNQSFYIEYRIFANETSAQLFVEEMLSATSQFILEREPITVDQFEGIKIKAQSATSDSELIAYLLRKNNLLLFVSGGSDDYLLEITQWFIRVFIL